MNMDSATFLYSIAKRARKYFLGLTTITQDVEDFIASDHGKAIVTNSSIQVLMKQSTSAIDKLAQVFFLSQGERHLLLTAEVGEALFFAGQNHVAMRVVASPEEHELITTNPRELLAKQQRLAALTSATAPAVASPVAAQEVSTPPTPAEPTPPAQTTPTQAQESPSDAPNL